MTFTGNGSIKPEIRPPGWPGSRASISGGMGGMAFGRMGMRAKKLGPAICAKTSEK